jgi:hypothetical protein
MTFLLELIIAEERSAARLTATATEASNMFMVPPPIFDLFAASSPSS